MTSKQLVSALTLIREAVSRRRSWIADGIGSRIIAWNFESADKADQTMLNAIEAFEKLVGSEAWAIRDGAHTMQSQRDHVIEMAQDLVHDSAEYFKNIEELIATLIRDIKDGSYE